MRSKTIAIAKTFSKSQVNKSRSNINLEAFSWQRFFYLNMPYSQTRPGKIYIHFVVWGLYIACNLLIQRLYYPAFDDYIGHIFNYFSLILIFYLNAHFVIERYAKRKTILTLIALTILLFFLYFGLIYSFQHYISPLIYGEPASDSNFRLFFWGSVYTFLPYLGFSYGYWYFRRAIRHQKEINDLLIQQQKEKEEKLHLAKERLFYEYSFLQAQINPHFLFNTLSFFYSKTLPFSTEVSEGILKLSEIMRYALENREGPEGKVRLANEINHLRNVIDINQLRFSNKLNIQFDVKGNIEGYHILPLVLITLVENAFKHGELTDMHDPLKINLCICEQQKQLNFKVRNKKKKGPHEYSNGIGMKNIRDRLNWVYPGNYSLAIKDEENKYTVELQLNL